MKSLSPSSPPFKLKPPEAAAGCLSGILRRFLCGDSDGRGDADLVVDNRERTEEKSPHSPGIVARLMGLETMPNFPSAAADSIGRSRSTNSVESWPGFLNERYRSSSQIKTSASFREVPTYLTKENEEFLLLSFGPEDKGERKKNKDGREQKNRRCEESKARRKRSADSKTDDDSTPFLVCQSAGLESSQREVVLEAAECVTQNSSPVSVLDHADGDDGVDDDDEYDARPNSTTLEEMNPPTKQQSSRRKLSSNFENFDCAFPPIQREEGLHKVDEGRERSSKHERVFPDVTDLWGHIRGLSEEDLRNTAWVSRELRSKEGGEYIVAEIGLELLDLLLNEATQELFKNMVYV